MTIVARRRAALLVPWVALAAVSLFAFLQTRARHEAERTRAPASSPPSATISGDGERAGPTLAVVQATEDALDAALVDFEEARARAADLERDRMAVDARRETAEARLSVSKACVEALEAEAAVHEQEAKARDGELEGLRERIRILEDPVLGWIEDAGSEEADRQAKAREAAAKAQPEEVARLRALLEASPMRAAAVANLVSALPESDDAGALVVRVLLAPDAGSERVALVGADALARPAVALALVEEASPEVLGEVLRWLAGRREAFDAHALGLLAEAVRPRLDGFDPVDVATAARAVGVLGLPGAAADLIVLTRHEDVPVRAAAVHALSRIPDLADVREEAERVLLAQLLDDALEVRIAGRLLAEALLGSPVDYDPKAGEAARRKAVDEILDRLD